MIMEIINSEIVLLGYDAVSIIDILKFFIAFILSYFSKLIFAKFSKQNWLSSYSNSLSFLLLPVIAFGVTTIISDNIALSLGLVGALSIVRFRTPVKNPFELIAYFYLLSIGIILSVSLTMSIIFVLCVSAIVIFAPSLIKESFTEEDFDLYSENAILTFSTKNETSEIPINESRLIYKSFEEKIFMYRFLFTSFEDAEKFAKSLNDEELIEYNIEKASFL